MGRASSSRRTAEVLRRTIEQLEADPTVDTGDRSFIDLKCSLLNRILEIETGKARTEAAIHLVDAQENQVEQEDKDDSSESNSAIA